MKKPLPTWVIWLYMLAGLLIAIGVAIAVGKIEMLVEADASIPFSTRLSDGGWIMGTLSVRFLTTDKDSLSQQEKLRREGTNAIEKIFVFCTFDDFIFTLDRPHPIRKKIECVLFYILGGDKYAVTSLRFLEFRLIRSEEIATGPR